MKSDSRNIVDKKDFIIIAVILLLGLSFLLYKYTFANNSQSMVAVVSIDGEICEKYNLSKYMQDEEIEISLKEKYNVPVTVIRFKAMMSVFFAKGEFNNFQDVMKCDTERYSVFFREMLNNGILFPPAQFEGLFLSDSHTDADIDKTLLAFERAIKVAFTK
ncbi:MAG: NusG domain II-containing protein, partial [Oscillospiraceae bacterium]